ncbi:MAG: flavin reductase [Fibrobacteraceae bacterium]|nr:flavin reductase [Fibrobacteraceae bacterium]
MANFKKMDPKDLAGNPFTMIGSDWMLIAAQKDGKANAMTASWGGLGILWNKPVAFIFIRQTRYTKEFVDSSPYFSLNFFDGQFKKELGYFGRVSGRDEDKISKAGMKVSLGNTEENPLKAPIFDDAKKVFVCRKLFAPKNLDESFIEKELLEKFYNKDSQHTLYVGEIEELLTK